MITALNLFLDTVALGAGIVLDILMFGALVLAAFVVWG